MPNFTLYDLNPEFWARVQAKAAAEGTTVKAVILKLLLQWLGVVALLVSSACAPHALAGPSPVTVDLTTPARLIVDATPGTNAAAGTAGIRAIVTNSIGAPLGAIPIAFTTDAGTLSADTATDASGVAHVTLTGPAGPAHVTARTGALTTAALVALQAAPTTPTPTPDPAPTPLPVPPPGPAPLPLSVGIVSTTGIAGTPTLFGLSINAPVARADWTFGDGAIATTAGAQTSHVYASGSFPVSVGVVDDRGRTASAQTTVTIAPAPSPPVTPAPLLAAVITCAPAAIHTVPAPATPCNVSATYGGTPVPSSLLTRVDWDWGDGTTTLNGGAASTRTYANAGTYTVIAAVTATTVDGTRTTTTTKMITVL